MKDFESNLFSIKDEYNNISNSIIIAKDYIYENGKKSKLFTLIDKEDISKIKKDYHYYELILEKEGYCYKMYYDIDLYVDNKDIYEYNTKLNQFKETITKYYKELDDNFNKDDIIELEASRDSIDGKYKISKHFIIPIYVLKPENLYVLFTFINTKIQNEIDAEIYDAIDKEVYIKTPKKSHQLRLLGQTKIGKPDSILKCNNPNIKIEDTLITQYDTDNKKLINTDEMEIKLKKMADKRGYMINDVENTIDKEDLEIGKMGYNYKDMLNINLKIPKNDIFIEDIYFVTSYRCCDINKYLERDCITYLSVIENTPERKQTFRLWWVIGTILKKYKIDYDIFEEWTLKAYKTNLNEVRAKCRAKWDMMKTTKYGLIHLINIAKLYYKDIYLKIVFAKKFNKQYYYDKDEWETINKSVDEIMDINKYYKQGKIGLITDENVGGGKTNAVIRFTKENINKEHFTIIFSNRILFATEISSRFSVELGNDKVINYDENRKTMPDLKDFKVLIISFESLLKWREVINKRIKKTTKLICIYDEFETLHRNITAETMKSPYKTIVYICELWRKSVFNIIIDAYMTRNTYEFVNKQNELSGKKGKMVYIDTENKNNYPKSFNIRGIAKTETEREEMMKYYTADMGKILNENEENKIVIFCEVYKSVQYIYSYLINTIKIPKDKIAIHTGKNKDYLTDEELDGAKDYFRDKSKMIGVRVWIYTSSILNGISIENVKFNKCYGIITKYSKQLQSSVGIYANDFLNAIARSRLNNEWEVYIDKKENTAFTYKKYKQMNTDVSIDSKIEVAITKELNIQELKRQVDDYDSDENEIINTSVEIAELNSYIRNPKKYRFDVSSGLSAINYIKVYEKYDMTGKVLYEIKYDKYIEWKEKGYLTGDTIANDIINIVIKNNSITEELNGIFKEEVLICLAIIKWNYINMRLDMKQKFNKLLLNDGDNLICGKMKSVVISNWDKRELYNIDRIHTILEKYYGISGEIKDRMVKVIMGDYNLKRWLDNWIAIITKERTDSFNPIFVIEILKNVFNITKLKELPDKICPEKIDELELYEKSKETINKFKKSLGCKITPDPKTRKGAIFIKYLNEILKDTGYMYKAITKQRYIINYELVRVNIEIEVNEVKEKVVSDFWERIWDNNKISFIDDDIDE